MQHKNDFIPPSIQEQPLSVHYRLNLKGNNHHHRHPTGRPFLIPSPLYNVRDATYTAKGERRLVVQVTSQTGHDGRGAITTLFRGSTSNLVITHIT